MRRTLLVALAPFLLAGCLTPLTRRLDEANARAAALQQQLIIATEKFEEAKAILERSEGKIDQANNTFLRIETRINEMDTKFGTIEQGFRKMFGLKGPLPQE